jgi:CheY-like chemotaxis protein
MEKPIILIVDDNRDLRETLAELLEEEGYDTACCEDGAAALAYLRSAERHPALIVLDLMMPVMNGWQFREAQLADAQLCAVPVVGMTANGSTASLRDVRTMLLKPFGIGELLRVIEQYRPPQSEDCASQTTLDFTTPRAS